MNDVAERYLQTRWPDGMVCPMCQGTEWACQPDSPHVIENQPTDIFGAGEVFPIELYFFVCVGCGFVAPIHGLAVDGAQEIETLDEAIEVSTKMKDRL